MLHAFYLLAHFLRILFTTMNLIILLAAAIHLTTWQQGAVIVATSTSLQTGTYCTLVRYGVSSAKQHQHCL